jgi:hypothetical protein
MQRNPTRLRAGLRIPARATDFSPKPARLWGSPSPLFSGYRAPFRQGENDGVMKLVIYFHLAPRLQMNGAVPQLPPYASTARTETTL